MNVIKMNELNTLELVSKTSSKNEKLAILKKGRTDRLTHLLDAVFNFNRKFFLIKVPSQSKVASKEKDLHAEFIKLLALLESQEERGNEAIARVQSFMDKCTKQQATWYKRVIQKDLKAGFSVKTANKAGFNIPVFEVMLAKDGKNCKKLKEIVKAGVWVSPKFDGYRCLAVIRNGDVTLFSRNGSVYQNFPKIEKSLAGCFPKGNHVFDGEIMSDDFQSMQKTAFASKKRTTVGDVRYHIFGIIPYEEWASQKFKMKTNDRIGNLKIKSKKFDNNLVLVDQIYTTSLDGVYGLEEEYVTIGYEGAMMLPNIPYYLGKKTNKLLKFKTMLSQDCKVVGLYEGKEGTKYEGMMGGFELTQENGKHCECGSGFSDEDREYMWENRNKVIGRIAEIKYQELTNDGIMRFPIFLRWRDDK